MNTYEMIENIEARFAAAKADSDEASSGIYADAMAVVRETSPVTWLENVAMLKARRKLRADLDGVKPAPLSGSFRNVTLTMKGAHEHDVAVTPEMSYGELRKAVSEAKKTPDTRADVLAKLIGKALRDHANDIGSADMDDLLHVLKAYGLHYGHDDKGKEIIAFVDEADRVDVLPAMQAVANG